MNNYITIQNLYFILIIVIIFISIFYQIKKIIKEKKDLNKEITAGPVIRIVLNILVGIVIISFALIVKTIHFF